MNTKKLEGYYEGYMSKEAGASDIFDVGSSLYLAALAASAGLGVAGGIAYDNISSPSKVDIKNVQNAYLANKLKNTINARRRLEGLPDLTWDENYAKPPLINTKNIKDRLRELKQTFEKK